MDKKYFFKRLTPEYVIKPFDCGDEDLNDFFLHDAKSYQEQLLAVTYYVDDDEKCLLYFSLSNDKVSALENNNNFWRKVKALFPHSKHRKDYPSVKIGRLGINKVYQNTGAHLGSIVLDYIKNWMIDNNKTGCRFITVDAYRSAVPFYEKNGFRFMGKAEQDRYEKGKTNTIAMYFDLKTLLSD